MEPDCISFSVFPVLQIGLNNTLSSFHVMLVLVMYFSSIASQVYNHHTFIPCNIAWSVVDKLIKAQESSIS